MINRCHFMIATTLLVSVLSQSILKADTSAEPDAKAEQKEANDLRQSLLGAWALAGPLDGNEDPQPGARMKFWGLKHWCITETDSDTGELMFHHGGTYTLEGNKYTETITFAAESTREMVGMTLKFDINVKDDVYIQKGDGNSFDERWVRLKNK